MSIIKARQKLIERDTHPMYRSSLNKGYGTFQLLGIKCYADLKTPEVTSQIEQLGEMSTHLRQYNPR